MAEVRQAMQMGDDELREEFAEDDEGRRNDEGDEW